MTHKSIVELRGFSTDQLIEELARRSNERGTTRPRDWCEDCAHFIAWVDGKTPDAPIPDDYNPCAKRHAMRFQAPEGYPDQEAYGHYRTVCADRNPIEQKDAHE